MNEWISQRTEFGVICRPGLVLVAFLLLSFSKNLSIFTPTYDLNLCSSNVGGLKDRAAVLLAGVTIGNVSGVDITNDDGKGVTIRLKIQQRYKIHRDARFVIEQIGFLGDQVVSIYPTENKAPILPPDAQVYCEEPINVQDVVRSVGGLIQGATQTVDTVSRMVARLDNSLFTDQNLSNVTAAIGNFRLASDKAVVTLNNVGHLVDTNSQSGRVQ